MTRPDRQHRLGLWLRQDCIALTALLGMWGAHLAAASVGHAPADEAGGIRRRRIAAVAERIDPNTASIPSLRRLPMIGPGKARAIAAFRQAARAGGTAPAFRFRQDLLQVPGIGPETLRRAAQWLDLPTAGPTSTQS